MELPFRIGYPVRFPDFARGTRYRMGNGILLFLTASPPHCALPFWRGCPGQTWTNPAKGVSVVRQPLVTLPGHRHLREALQIAAELHPGLRAVAIDLHRRLEPGGIVEGAGPHDADPGQDLRFGKDRRPAIRAEL